jgi:excisionase family DNA binding protein
MISEQKSNSIVQDNTNDCTDLPIRRLLRIEEVAEILQVSRSYCYQLVQTGQLPAVKLGRSRRIRIQDALDFIEANVSNGAQFKGGVR